MKKERRKEGKKERKEEKELSSTVRTQSEKVKRKPRGSGWVHHGLIGGGEGNGGGDPKKKNKKKNGHGVQGERRGGRGAGLKDRQELAALFDDDNDDDFEKN